MMYDDDVDDDDVFPPTAFDAVRLAVVHNTLVPKAAQLITTNVLTEFEQEASEEQPRSHWRTGQTPQRWGSGNPPLLPWQASPFEKVTSSEHPVTA